MRVIIAENKKTGALMAYKTIKGMLNCLRCNIEVSESTLYHADLDAGYETEIYKIRRLPVIETKDTIEVGED